MITFPHHDLNSGLVATVKRIHEPELKDELDRAIVASHKTRDLVSVGKFRVFADLSTVMPDGTSYFVVTAGARLGEGRVPVGKTLYNAVAAAQLATSPSPWRYLFNRYLSAVSECESPATLWSAPGGIPHGTPWLCGFSTASAALLLDEEKILLWKLVRSVGFNVLERCERGAAAAARDGNIPEVDTELYPELREEWDP
jgi:hypothetical protein